MKNTLKPPRILNSISELHKVLSLPEPEHPLVSMVNFADVKDTTPDFGDGMVMNFYIIAVKKEVNGKIRYGQNYYDFDEGVMSFIAPLQICYMTEGDPRPGEGFMLMFHPDYIRNYPLGKKIKNYDFFSYSVHEALMLSKKEELVIEGIMNNIQQEYHSNIDQYSQDVIISQIELLLNYSNRFYNRQFLTRKNAHNDTLIKLEAALDRHFANEQITGLPTVKQLADLLNVSPHYLSDMLRSLTGQNAQQHIHSKLIEKAKEVLVTTPLSVSEIAYRLGFEYPQSFSKLFKNKTNISPLEYRKQFN